MSTLEAMPVPVDRVIVPGQPRVLHVVESLEVGGLERLVHDLAIGRGAETTSVACLDTVGPFGEALRKRGLAVELIGTQSGYLPALWRLCRCLRRLRPDLIHCHNLPAVLYAGIAARLNGRIPVVVTKHGPLRPRTGMSWRLIRVLTRRAYVAAVSPEAQDIMETWLTGGEAPVRYISNGISMAPYEARPTQRDARLELGLPAEAFIVGIVARVTGTKGHLMLLDAFAGVLRRVPGALLLIVGDGAGLPVVQDRVQELAIANSVLVMGERSDVPTILAAMNVFCLPSEKEGMPMTVLEAMAAGLPVIASKVGAIPQVVEDGRTGLMTPAHGKEELEAALLTLASHPESARKMGEAGRQRVKRDFSLDGAIQAYEELYREAIEGRSMRTRRNT